MEKKIILREHSVELNLYKSLIKNDKNILRIFFYLHELKKFFNLRKNIYPKFSGILFITEEERDISSSIYKVSNPIVIKPFVDKKYISTEIKTVDEKEINLLWVGDLEWVANRISLINFINILAESKHRKKIRLDIVGKGGSKIKLSKLSGLTINIHGYVDDISFFYRKCDFFVAYLDAGNGLKIKILEAMKEGLKILTSKIGSEGFPDYESYLFTINDVEDLDIILDKHLIKEIDHANIVKNYDYILDTHFNYNNQIRTLDKFLKNL